MKKRIPNPILDEIPEAYIEPDVMSEQGNIPIAKDLRELWENAQRGIRHIQAHPELDVKVAGDTVYRVATLIERCSRAEAERDQFKADASWAATHRSELADLRDAFAKSEAEVAQLKAENERLKAPVSDEESRAAGWTPCGQNFEQLRRIMVDALLTARTGGSNGK